jgi:hypothetical protein
MNKGPVVGNEAEVIGTFPFCANKPANAIAGNIVPNLPISIANPPVKL